MSPKKKKRPEAAQQLIDDLLDEKTAASNKGEVRPEAEQESEIDFNARPSFDSEQYENPVLLNLEETGKHHQKQNEDLSSHIELSNASPVNLSLEDDGRPMVADPIAVPTSRLKTPHRMSSPPPFEGTRPLVTQMAKTPPRVSEEPQIPEEPNENTMRIEVPKAMTSQAQPEPESQMRPIDRGGATEIRAGAKVPPAPKQPMASSAVFASSEAALKQSESLRIAQNRISELETELERIRRDNENLSTAGDTLRRRADELISKTENLELQSRESQRIADEERKVMRTQLQAKDRENAELRTRVEEIELRLESNFKKIRVRERELEHRLEIVKMESATLVSTKDKMLLDLKRQIDQLLHENDHAKHKTQEVFNQYKDKQETIRRVVRALRIALTILEGDDETVVPIRKAE